MAAARLTHSRRAWGLARAQLFLHIELVEQNALGATSHLGVGEISLAMLSEAEYTTVPITIMRAKAARTSAHVRLAREPAALKTVYFVRHGESVWNRAQARADVITLVSDTDHPLNDAGKQQAEALQRKLARLVELAHRDQSALEAWEADAQRRAEEIVAAGKVKQGEPGAVRAAAKAAAHAAAAEGARAERGESPRRRGRVAPGGAGAPPPPPSLLSDVERGLVDVQSIASSPLTRAIQTTAIGLAPLLRRSGARLRLMANLREKKNLGGFDSAGAAKGKAVRGRLRETTTPLFKGAEAALSEHVLKGTPLDTTEVEGKWWHDSPESKAEVRTRIDELLCQLQFASEERIALVGHSHFFREVFRHHLHPRYRARNRIMSMRLSGQKLENCGIVAVTFDFAERDRLYAELGEDGMRNRPEAAGVIVDVKLMLGTRLVGSESKLKL